MGDFIFNIGKGKINQLAALPNANDAFIVVALKASGLESDATLQDYATLAALLAASNDEATNSGYARKTITSLTVATDNTNNWTTTDMADQTWTAVATSGGAWGKVLVCYDGDTTGGTDADIIPLGGYDASVVPDGSDITVEINATGLWKAA